MAMVPRRLYVKAILGLPNRIKWKKFRSFTDKCGLTPDDIEQYGHYKAKISFDAIRRLEIKPVGRIGVSYGYYTDANR